MPAAASTWRKRSAPGRSGCWAWKSVRRGSAGRSACTASRAAAPAWSSGSPCMERREPDMSQLIKILLADDHTVLRAGLKALLDAEEDMHVVGEASNGEEAVDRAKALKPDVVVMDLSMPGMNGLEATRQIAALDQGTRVLVLTMHTEEEYLLPVLEAGG